MIDRPLLLQAKNIVNLQGAFVYEGKMIDRPLLLQAKNIVNLQEIIRSLDS